MKYTKPMPYKQALAASQVKVLLPTSLSSAELEQLDASALERGRFSAKVRVAGHLSILDDGVNDIVAGVSDFATQRLALKKFLRASGYQPAPEQRGTLQDFSSDARTDLQLQTNVQQAQGYGWWKQGQDQDLLFAFPAREFVRVEDREHPRENWPQRWNAARKATVLDGATDSGSGRMIALVNHPIWTELSRFHTPYEPFDYNSGRGLVDVARKVAIGLGLLGPETVIFPQDRPFNADLQASPQIRSDRLRGLLEASGVGAFDQDGVFHATGGDN